MDWEPKVKELYDNVVLRMPEMVKPVIAPELLEKAEEKCGERRGKEVAEVDLIIALFEITPTAFQPVMTADLKELGVDYDRYLAKVQSNFKCTNDLGQMLNDFAKICYIAGVSFNKNAVQRVFKAYKEFFIGAPVSIRTTTKSVERRDVALRYVEFFMPHNPDPYTHAINEGLIEKDDHPIHEMIIEAMNTFQMMGYGVDVDASTGLSKIWPFIVPGSIEPIFSMKSIPKSMVKYREYFLKHGLTDFSLFAFDFLHKTTNIYFMLKQPPKATYDNCIALVEDLGFKIASKEAMEGCTKAVHLNYTFSWESEDIERFCFGMACDEPKDVPVHFHPLMEKFVAETPLQSDSTKFIWGVAFTNNSFYYKIENDYNGAMIDFLGMGCKAGLDTYK
ncbi:MAG: aromatic prenyltransferase [Candidatus Thorarchaeota archaeon]